MIDGGCFCGKIRFQIDEGEYTVVNCHCTMCRRTSGAPFVTWVVVPGASFRFTQGAPRTLRSSSHGTRRFCAECGTPMTFESSAHPASIDVTTCSLDAPARFVPTRAVHEDAKLVWLGHTEPAQE